MASHREQVLDALTQLLTTALPGATVGRNLEKPTSPGPGGVVIVHDGDPGDPEVTLSPLSYTYEHRVLVDIAAFESATLTREKVLDGLFVTIGAAIATSRTLGGLAEWIEPDAPSPEDAQAMGTEAIRWAELGLVVVYNTASPLA